MKYYKNESQQVFAYNEDGSQDHLIPENYVSITRAEMDVLTRARQQAEFDAQDYYRKRIYSYPEPGEFLDAWVKGDVEAMEEYRRKCIAIKAKYPKPEGF